VEEGGALDIGQCFLLHRGGARPRLASVAGLPAAVRITEFTDPACPWAYSAEPFRRRLDWLYGDALEWEVALVGLSDSPEHYLDMGFTPERQSAAFRTIAHDHGMPIDTAVRPRMEASVPACRAVVAARLNAPDRVRRLLRRLRIRHFSGELLDEPATIEGAATDAGIDVADLHMWMLEAATEEALAADMAAARRPMPAALVLDARLANWSGGRRYTCPSYEMERLSDGVRISIPGFQPFAVYDVVTANLVPGIRRADPPSSAAEVLRWTGTPLATKEVAVVLDVPLDAAREELGRIAQEQHVGADGFWTLP
jgi:predicted DsbA family dithiol-disulfide isomerase